MPGRREAEPSPAVSDGVARGGHMGGWDPKQPAAWEREGPARYDVPFCCPTRIYI